MRPRPEGRGEGGSRNPLQYRCLRSGLRAAEVNVCLGSGLETESIFAIVFLHLKWMRAVPGDFFAPDRSHVDFTALHDPTELACHEHWEFA